MITTYEDNAGGLFISDGETMFDVTNIPDPSGESDMRAVGDGETYDWTTEQYAVFQSDLDRMTVVAELDDGHITLYENRMGANSRRYFGVNRPND